MHIKLEGEIFLTGTAPDGASVVVPVSINGLFGSEGVTLNGTAQAMDTLGTAIRVAHGRAQAMLSAVP